MKNSEKNFKNIQNHLSNFGFVFQGSQIYGGLANTWDYGPLGTLLNENIKRIWRREFIAKEIENVSIDSKIITNPQVWEASGHLDNFSDPLIENKKNGKRYRADKLIEEYFPDLNAESMSASEMEKIIKEKITEHEGSKAEWSSIRDFQLMFQTQQGVVEGAKSTVYLRPETAQGIFINFRNVQRAMRAKLPFGIGQIGKSFRNEVTPGNFIFRTREFEQMELEYFVFPEKSFEAHEYYVKKSFEFIKNIGLKEESIKLRKHSDNELAHYSLATTDVEFLFSFGWGELLGISNRGDYDLKVHMNKSGESLEYLDPTTNQKVIPHVIEPSIGLDRLALSLLVDAFEVEQLENDERVVLKLNKELAPFKVAVLPLSKKHHSQSAKDIFKKLIDQDISATYDEAGSIGKRYRRQDAIGTPFVITVIDESAEKGTVTIRHRDSMKQEEININDIKDYI